MTQGLNTTSIPYPTNTPLEAVVEAETVAAAGSAMTLWISALAGLDFLALLPAELAPAWSTLFPLAEPSSAESSSLPADQRAMWRLLAQGGLADGRAIYEALAPGAAVAAPLPQAPEPALVDAWRAAYGSYFQPIASQTWSGERLKYQFGVSAFLSRRELVLGAADYDGAGLDWSSFDVEPAITTRSPIPRRDTVSTPARIPVPVTFPGMPVSRFWEFEDARINFASVDAERTDLARLLFLEFTLAFGNDFFLIPHAMPVGSVCRTASLQVSDTFGERISIPPADAAWRMFQPSDRAGAAQNLLFLPPVLPRRLEGPALEEVRFARDEMANIVWALEKLVAGPLARSIRRAEQYIETHPRDGAPPTPPADGSRRYRLGTAVPDYWLPFVPVTDDGALFFKRDGLLPPQGAIVGGSALVREEEIPREGVEVSRSFQLARWIGGSTFLWVGRKRGVGTGEASSALKFDQLDP
ncbi:hypothetical protein WME75_21655 [Sorangium sp. So ce1014]|uniref:hypothetical protein n=1 Tax=Sorangium sp. So ce1014 TaxID=3133326 RepID=UPI003F648DF7